MTGTLAEEVEAVEADGLARVAAASSVAELRTVEQELVAGKRSALAALLSLIHI